MKLLPAHGDERRSLADLKARWGRERQSAVPPPACLAALLATLVGHYAAYLLAALAGAAVLWITHEARHWMVGVFTVFFVVGAAPLVAAATTAAHALLP